MLLTSNYPYKQDVQTELDLKANDDSVVKTSEKQLNISGIKNFIGPLKIGSMDGTTPTNSYIDFHTDGKQDTNYNSRILAPINSNNLRIQILEGGEFQIYVGTNRWLFQSDGNIKKQNGNIIIELNSSYRSGDSWYRKYGDGFIEQGGRFNISANDNTVPLITPFQTINYNVQLTRVTNPGTTNVFDMPFVRFPLQTNSFNLYSPTSTAISLFWTAVGN